MKEAQIVLKAENVSSKKNIGLQERILLRNWIGWGGGFSRVEKKS